MINDLNWSKTYPILTISRLYLRDACRIPTEHIANLTDEDMSHIVSLLVQYYGNSFEEVVRLAVILYRLERTSG